MDTLIHDLRYGLRRLRKEPGISALIVAIVGVGVGAAATIFSIVERSLLWNENPNVDRWVLARAFFPRQNLREFHFSSAEYFDFRGLTDVFERVGAARGINATLFIDNAPQLVEETFVTADMIPMTAIPPLFGRAFTPEDDQPGAPGTTVLTYECWQNRFRGDRGILGQTIRIDDQHYTVIGVMPPHYALWGGELYLPFRLDPANAERSNRQLRIVALIRRHVLPEQVDARLDQFARTLEREHSVTNPEYRDMRLTTWNIKQAVTGGVRPVLLILMGAVALIVAMSCANIANLLLSRASGRRREIALRVTLGASPLRVVRQLLVESVVVSLTGGGVGAILASWGVPAAMSLIGENQLPYADQIRLDGNALLLAFALSTVMGLLFGLTPAAYMAKPDLLRGIRDGGLQSGTGRDGRWMRNALVFSQIVLAMLVLASAGLMIRTYGALLRLDFGYNAHNVLTAQLTTPGDTYPTAEKVTAFYHELLERLRSFPGIDGAAVATGRPMMDRITDVATQDFSLAGQEGATDRPNANLRVVTAGYFDAIGVRLLRGRPFNDADTQQTEAVAIINQTMARLVWPTQDVVGQRIRLGAHYSAEPDGSVGRWVTVVGVVSDARQLRVLDVPVRQEIMFPLAQRPELARAVTIIVRSRLATGVVADTLKSVVAAVDPDRPIFGVMTLEQAIANSFAPKRLATVLLGFFAAVALALATLGLYAVVAYSVAQRTREIGIRIALGASARDVLRMIVAGSSWVAAAGLAAGLVAALSATRLMRSLVFDVSTNDPATFAVAGSLLAGIVFLATYLPARRATRIDPIIALRCE
jgi:putative ABC transport system permease protein